METGTRTKAGGGRICGQEWQTNVSDETGSLHHRCVSTERGDHIHACPCGAVFDERDDQATG